LLASIVGFITCTAGVNVGEANKVLTSFSIQWPEVFDNTCKSNEPLSVVINALDQDGNVFNWSGTVILASSNANVSISSASIDITNGSVQRSISFSNSSTKNQDITVKMSAESVVVEIPATLTVY